MKKINFFLIFYLIIITLTVGAIAKTTNVNEEIANAHMNAAKEHTIKAAHEANEAIRDKLAAAKDQFHRTTEHTKSAMEDSKNTILEQSKHTAQEMKEKVDETLKPERESIFQKFKNKIYANTIGTLEILKQKAKSLKNRADELRERAKTEPESSIQKETEQPHTTETVKNTLTEHKHKTLEDEADELLQQAYAIKNDIRSQYRETIFELDMVLPDPVHPGQAVHVHRHGHIVSPLSTDDIGQNAQAQQTEMSSQSADTQTTQPINEESATKGGSHSAEPLEHMHAQQSETAQTHSAQSIREKVKGKIKEGMEKLRPKIEL